MITAVDTNILLDILGKDGEYYKKSAQVLERQNQEGNMIISPIVYAEILVSFLRKAEKKSAVQKLKEFLLDMGIESVEFTEEDFILASDAWNTSLKTKEIQCPSCGAFNTFFCKKCKRQVSWRNHILTDFLIGAHAQNHADVLVTRDRGYYKKYFKVNIME